MRGWAVLAFLFLCGHAQAALFADNDAREEIVKLRKYVKEQQDARLTELQTRLDNSEKARQALEQRLTELERHLVEAETGQKNQVLDLLAQMERLNTEISQLRGQIEVGDHALAQIQQRQRDLYADLDGRLRKLEGATVPPRPADAAPAPAATEPQTPTTTPPTPPQKESGDELKAYEVAHELFKSGKYKESADAFEKFLEAYSGSKFAPNAHYWAGYAHFSQKNYKAAIAGQQKLLKLYPDHHKVPDALYNIANSQIQLADIEAAKRSLHDLLEKYPTSDAAALAKKRLIVLESVKPKN